MEKLIESWLRRFAALFDKSAWLLIAPAFLALYLIDAPSAITLAQWSLFALVIAGVSVVISRIVFPDIRLREWLLRSCGTAHGAGLVVAALIIFVGMVMLTLAIWAKP